MDKPPLEGVIWLLTPACPLRCKHCYAAIYSCERELGLGEKLRLAKEIGEQGISWVNISGGEPLLHPHFWPVVEVLREYGVNVSANTNGLGVNEETARKLSRLEITVYLSVDGGKREHELLRGAGTYDHAIRALELLSREGIEFNTVMTVARSSLSGVEAYLETAAKYGVEYPAMIPSMMQGRATWSREWVDSKAYVEAVKKAAFLAEELGLKGVWLWCTPFNGILGLKNTFSSPCRTRRLIDITPSGNLVLCDVTGIRISNVADKGLVKALEEYQQHPLLKIVEEPPELPQPCKTCPIRQICRGGCFARALLEHGNLNGGDPLCPRVSGWRNRNRRNNVKF